VLSIALGLAAWSQEPFSNGRRVGYDLAVAGECGRCRECGDCTTDYGPRVLAIECRPTSGGLANTTATTPRPRVVLMLS